MHKCKTCGEMLPENDFRLYYSRNNKSYLRHVCKACESKAAAAKTKAKYHSDPEFKKQRIQQTVAWQKKNNAHRREYLKAWQKKREQSNLAFRMSRRVSTAVRKNITNKNNTSTFDHLPYTAEDLILHLEKQFEPWMSWKNYGNKEGQWSLDHILPVSLFPYESLDDHNFKMLWDLRNLRPLPHSDNVSKNNKLTQEAIELLEILKKEYNIKQKEQPQDC